MFYKSVPSLKNMKPISGEIYRREAHSLIFCIAECVAEGCKCRTVAFNSETKECLIYGQPFGQLTLNAMAGFELVTRN